MHVTLCQTLALLVFSIAATSGQTQLPVETTVETPTSESTAISTSTSQATLRLPLAIHYETLCPDSMYFIRRRLYDALINNDWWSLIELKLYPFGKAGFYNNTEVGELQVFCQHGDEECELNALHACLIEHLTLTQAFEMIYCMLRSYKNAVDQCAKHLTIDVTAAMECKRTRKTADILLPYGRETLKLELSFVPSIVFNNDFLPYEQSNIRYNFETYFCRQYQKTFQIKPPKCD